MEDGFTDAGDPISPNLVFRRLGLDDFSTVRHIHASAVRALADKLIEPAEAERAGAAIYSADYVIDLNARALTVALLNGDIVATGGWIPGDDRGYSARIGMLFVAPLFQGRGIGSQLVTAVEQDAEDGGFHRFTAIVPVLLAPMFEDLGYTVASFGTSQDVIPRVNLQVAFMRKPG